MLTRKGFQTFLKNEGVGVTLFNITSCKTGTITDKISHLVSQSG